MNTVRRSLAMAALTVAVGFSLQARAGIWLKISDGVNTKTANDATTPGFAQFDGTVGSFAISSDAGVGFPAAGAPTDPLLDLTSLDVTSKNAGGTLEVLLTETGFTTISAGDKFLSSLVGNYVNSKATLATYLDTGDVAFGMGTSLSSGLLDNAAGLASVSPFAGSYSLTEMVTITAGAGSTTSLDALVVDAPEPGSLPLLGAALAAFGLLGRRFASASRRRAFTPV